MLHPLWVGELPPVNRGGIFHPKEMFSTAWGMMVCRNAPGRAGTIQPPASLPTGMWFLERLALCIWGEQLGR